MKTTAIVAVDPQKNFVLIIATDHVHQLALARQSAGGGFLEYL
jgi:hypothetical protein